MVRLFPSVDPMMQLNVSTSNASKQHLSERFCPGNWDVICHNGTKPHNHIGNRRFRICIENYLRTYMKASSRSETSAVITDIVASIRESSTQGGGFIRFDSSSNCWYKLGDKVARDKVGQSLRDSIRSLKEKKKKLKKLAPPTPQIPPMKTTQELFTMSAFNILSPDHFCSPSVGKGDWIPTQKLCEWFEAEVQSTTYS